MATNPNGARFVLLLVMAAVPVLAQLPRIDQIQNNYSFLLPDNPSYGIAQGSIFIVRGANLAATSTAIQSIPLSTTLNGVSARVTVNGASTDVLWYYVTPEQLGGVLPSRTPVGTGTITVTTAAGTSAPASIKVVQSALGILTLNATTSAAAYDANYAFLSARNSAKPGDAIQLFGSGLGPVSENESGLQTQVDLTSVTLIAEVGGVPATVAYRGRTIFPGLDQINIVIPPGVTPGCAVPLTLRTGAFSSNTTTIPVSATGGNCPATSGTQQISEAEKNAWLAAGSFRTGSVGLTRQTSYSLSDTATGGLTTMVNRSDVFTGGVNRIGGADLGKLLNSQVAPPEAGSCTFYNGSPVNPYPNLTYTSLDLGPALSVSGPAGTRSAPRSRNSVGNFEYSATVGTGDPGNYADPGRYTFTGPGGADVGAFSGTIEIAPELIWTNRTSLTAVDRSQPLTLTWSGGEPSTLITIQGTSTTVQGSSTSITSFQCFARNTDGRFTVPVSVLSRMLASSRINAGGTSILIRGSLAIASVGTGTRMSASGVDYLTAGNQWGVAQTVEYK